MVRLALGKAPAGPRMHAVAEAGLRPRDIAAMATTSACRQSRSCRNADAYLGWIGRFLGMDLTASSTRTRGTWRSGSPAGSNTNLPRGSQSAAARGGSLTRQDELVAQEDHPLPPRVDRTRQAGWNGGVGHCR